ncbi:MAG: CaiB/BaiF CoA transferase family protein [Burkholderiales bacterium]
MTAMTTQHYAAGKPLPLAGVKVIDFSRLLPGPFATMMLGELGADVIKVEQPGIGDPSRHNHPRYRQESVYFHATNGNKRSIALDMATKAGKEVGARLLRWGDVAVESFRPGVAARLGMDYVRAQAINPRIIYCSITGFGQSGPLAHIAGHDLAIQALTGLMGCSPDGEAPVPGFQAADFAGSLYAVIGIQAALAQRAQTGVGCEVDLAMFEALFNMCFLPLSSAFAQRAGHSGEPRMESFGANPRYATYRTKDGRQVAITLLEAKAWREFCAHIGRPDLVSAEETPADRLGNHGERAPAYRAALAEYCGTQTWDELMRQMEQTGIAICPVAAPADAVGLAHVDARDMVGRIEHPVEGSIPQFLNPLWRAGLARKHHRPAPALGEHTREILQTLGYSSSEISRLSSDKVVEG